MAYDTKLYNSLLAMEEKYKELERELESQTNDIKKISEISKTLKDKSKIMERFQEYKSKVNIISNFDKLIEENKNDKDMVELIQLEFNEANSNLEDLELELKILLLPKDSNDEKNVIIEMRPAAGGDESSIFVRDLFEAYQRYFNDMKWKVQILESVTDTHGLAFISFSVKGENVYSKLKFESGVHRVQRVPATESKGRVHTSTITVAVLPEVEDIDIKLNKADIREDKYRASGAGGQHVNKTESAIRLTHIPTGIVVSCQEDKSQHVNRENAYRMLNAKIYEMMREQQHNELSETRRSQVGSGDRSEKIRTYNYPQNRVTDHRINLTLNKLDSIMQGDFEEIINGLISEDQLQKLSNLKL